MSSHAADMVLKTPELLELIMMHLDQQQVFTARHVCRKWKDIITSSPPLRKMLYLSPTSTIDPRIPVDNPWLKSRFPDLSVYLLTGNPKWRPKFVRALSISDLERLGQDFFREPDASWRDMLLTQPPIKELIVFAAQEEIAKPASKKSKKKISRLGADGQALPDAVPVPSMEEMRQSSITVRHKEGITMGMIVDAGVEARKRSFAAARKKLADRKDSGYNSVNEDAVEQIEVSVIEIRD